MSQLIRVLAAVIRMDDRYLVAQRARHKRHGGCWEFPGGKVEPGETDFDALARELREELDVTLHALGRAWCTHRDGDSPFEITFIEAYVRGTPRALEHEALAWVTTEELPRYALAPSDALCAAAIVRNSG